MTLHLTLTINSFARNRRNLLHRAENAFELLLAHAAAGIGAGCGQVRSEREGGSMAKRARDSVGG
jgi:hypothetical protein